MTVSKKIFPKICVWEVTLACNANCLHCGSFAGKPRGNELNTKEALALIDQLAELGCRSVTLSGGEPLLRRDWPELVQAIKKAGMRPELITNGLIVKQKADEIADADFFAVTFSVDGPPVVHDKLRALPGCFFKLVDGVHALIERGVLVGAVTQINMLNKDLLDETHDLLVKHGFKGWQVQLTIPTGRAGENNADICMSPKDLLPLESKLIEIRKRTNLFMQAADTIGYMSRGEPYLRTGAGNPDHFWGSCSAGLQNIGITSDGTVRGCLSMPPDFDEDNIRNRSLKDIWNDENAFAYNRKFKIEELEGWCADCSFNKLCRGGCPSQAFAVTGDVKFNPYCLRQLGENKKNKSCDCIEKT